MPFLGPLGKGIQVTLSMDGGWACDQTGEGDTGRWVEGQVGRGGEGVPRDCFLVSEVVFADMLNCSTVALLVPFASHK